MFTAETQNGSALESADRALEMLQRIANNGIPLPKSRKRFAPVSSLGYEIDETADTRPVLALFCFENETSVVGEFVASLAATLANRSLAVHLFVRAGFDLADVAVHHVGGSEELDGVEQVQEFARRAGNEFLGTIRVGFVPVTLLGCEWSSIPVLTLLQGIKNLDVLLSLHSLERQRADMSSEISKQSEDIELAGLRAARAIFVHDPATAEVAKTCVPECGARILNQAQVFPVARFNTKIDHGQVKARYQVGPIDPTILFVGDLSERYGPDLLIKAMPAVLKNHKQARLVIVGDGSQYWPLRVYTRYLLLEHAVRLVGNVQGKALDELIEAADIIAVPSRDTSPWWPFLAGWAAKKPIVATHQAAPGVLTEENSVLCYPSENSCVWAIERILYDEEFARRIATEGHDKLQERYGWKNVAAQLENLLGVAAAPAN